MCSEKIRSTLALFSFDDFYLDDYFIPTNYLVGR